GDDLAAGEVIGELHAVADAEHGNAEVEDFRIAGRRPLLVDAGRPARQDDAARLQLAHPFGRDAGPHELAEDVLLAHPPGDELSVLRAEVEDQDALSVRNRTHDDLPSSMDRCVAVSTASIKAARMPPRSRACRPAMVVPAGLATMSLSWAGCMLVSSSIWAAPSSVWAASVVARSRGKPMRTPPS